MSSSRPAVTPATTSSHPHPPHPRPHPHHYPLPDADDADDDDPDDTHVRARAHGHAFAGAAVTYHATATSAAATALRSTATPPPPPLPPLTTGAYGYPYGHHTSPSPRTRRATRDVDAASNDPGPSGSHFSNHHAHTHSRTHSRSAHHILHSRTHTAIDTFAAFPAPLPPGAAPDVRPSVPTTTTAHPPASSASGFPPNPPRSSSLHTASAAPAAVAANKPPRTSSLLPPARIVVNPASPQDDPLLLLRDPFNDPRPAPPIPDLPTRDGDAHSHPKHKRGHSRSSSAGGLSDTFRNLNRWSASTTSSRASNLADFTRRVSAEILGVAFHSSPGKKLHRRGASTSSASPRSSAHNPTTRPGAESPSATAAAASADAAAPAALVPPLQSLPRISAGPSLEHEVLESNVLTRRFSPPPPLPPPDLPGHTRQQPSDDYYGAFWDGHSGGPDHEHGLSLHHAPPAEPPRPSDMTTHESTMPHTQNGQFNGHSRSRSTGARGSADTTVSSRSRDRDHRDRERDRTGRPPSQRTMLSKALEKANTAVQLDNAQNFEGARRAYAEACAALQQVLLRTSGEEDRRKLEAIVSADGSYLFSFRLPAVSFSVFLPLTNAYRSTKPTWPESWSWTSSSWMCNPKERHCPVDPRATTSMTCSTARSASPPHAHSRLRRIESPRRRTHARTTTLRNLRETTGPLPGHHPALSTHRGSPRPPRHT